MKSASRHSIAKPSPTNIERAFERDANRNSSLALWAVVAVVSPASEIVFQLVAGSVPNWLLSARIAALTAVLVATAYVKRIRALWPLCLAYLFQLILMAIRGIATTSPAYRSWVLSHGFVGGTLALHMIGLMLIAPVVIWFLRSPDRFYFRLGDPAARVELPWLETGEKPLRWNTLGLLFALVSGLVAWTFVGYTGREVSYQWRMALWAVLFACVNSFGKELLNRNILVSTVQPAFGAQHAILVSSVIFGIGHWNGLPAGPIGVVMTFVLGYVAAKALIETRGMFWPWFMHMVPDCVLFYYWGLGAVAHGQLG